MMSNRVGLYLGLTALAVAAVACKAEVKPDPETERRLAECEKAKGDKDSYIKELEKRLADFELAGAGGEVVITIKGDDMVIDGVTGKGPNARTGVATGSAKDTELYEAFLAAVKRSRGQLKQCYQQALKKNSALQARSIPLQIEVKYRTDGKVSTASFNPRVSVDFDRCMKNVAEGWSLPAMPNPVTFNSQLTLTPE